MKINPEISYSADQLPLAGSPVSARWAYTPGRGSTTPAQATDGLPGLYVVVRSEDGFTETLGYAVDVKWVNGGVEVLTRSRGSAIWFRLGNVAHKDTGSIRCDYLLVEGDEPVNA